MANLEIKQDVHESAVVVVVSGDIDTATVDALVHNLDNGLNVASAQSHKLLVVDLGDVTYFGSAGLNALLGCYEAGATNGVAVRLVANAAEVLRPLEVTQLDAVVRPYPTLSDALAAATDAGG